MSTPTDYLSSLFGLHGKKVLITGGSRGIGRGLVTALASAGADIILLARNISSKDVISTTEAVKALGRSINVYACDLADHKSVLSVVPRVCVEAGIDIDIFVHCGGIQHRSPAEDFPDEAWSSILDVNLTAGFTLSRDLAKHWFSTGADTTASSTSMKKIIFIASITTFTGSIQIPAYTASKAAIGGLTKALSNEWTGKGINVNAIAPGYIATELTSALREYAANGDGPERQKEKDLLSRVPAGRWGIPEDLAGAVIHLASRSSNFISGEIHVVDGGFCGR